MGIVNQLDTLIFKHNATVPGCSAVCFGNSARFNLLI